MAQREASQLSDKLLAIMEFPHAGPRTATDAKTSVLSLLFTPSSHLTDFVESRRLTEDLLCARHPVGTGIVTETKADEVLFL